MTVPTTCRRAGMPLIPVVTGIRPAVEHALAGVVPRIHESIESGIDGRHDGVVRQQTVVGRTDQGPIRPLEDIDVADFDHVRAEIPAHRLDHDSAPQPVDAARPADQEFADVVDRDRDIAGPE